MWMIYVVEVEIAFSEWEVIAFSEWEVIAFSEWEVGWKSSKD